MNELLAALQIKKGDLVALVGGGGKTTALYGLAAGLSGKGRVLVTTTTRILYPRPPEAPRVVLAGSLPEARAALAAAFRAANPVVLGSGREGEKLAGIPPAWLDVLAEQADYCLVEADGAAGRPLKGYAPHEPVVPGRASLVLALAGLDCLGEPLGEQVAHRPEMVAAVSGLPPGERITPAVLGRALQEALRRAGKQAPGARRVAILNKAETTARWTGARRAAALLAGWGIPVLAGSLREARLEAVRPDLPVAAAVLLAAGEARRFGQPKLLLPYRGKTILEHALDNLLLSPLGQVVVVVGGLVEEMRRVTGARPVEVVENPAYREGQAGSLLAGLRVVRREAAAVLFALADQPLVPARVPETLLENWQAGRPVAVPVFRGRRGNPVLFGRELFPALAQLTGDRGGRTILAEKPELVQEVPVDCPGVLRDVDTPADYTALVDGE